MYLVNTVVMVRLEPGNSERRIKGNGQCGFTGWEMKTNCGASCLLLLLPFFKLNFLSFPRFFLGRKFMSQWLTDQIFLWVFNDLLCP